MKVSKIFCPLICLVVLLTLPFTAFAEDAATVKGKLVQSRYKGFDIDLVELKTRMVENVEYQRPTLPANWNKLTAKDRENWIIAFRKTPKGKALIAKNDSIAKNAEVFDIKVEKNGSFIVYDVPPGRYGLRGRIDKKIKNRMFAFEVFGQVDVLKDVDELVLDPIRILVTPLLKRGESAPSYQVKTHNNAATLEPKHFRGKYVFINFWTTQSPPSVEFQLEVQKMLNTLSPKHNIELLSVSVDEERKKAISHIKKAKLKGRHGFTDGWEHRMLEAYGVRAIPSHWLIDPDGKLLMTHGEFRQAFMAGKPDLATIINDRIEGKDAPTPAEAEKVGAAEGSASKK